MKDALPSNLKFIGFFDKKVTPSNSVLKEIIDLLRLVDTKSPEAKQNETSISDNNGGRIML